MDGRGRFSLRQLGQAGRQCGSSITHHELELDDTEGAALRGDGEPGLGVLWVHRKGRNVWRGGVDDHLAVEASGAIFPPIDSTQDQTFEHDL